MSVLRALVRVHKWIALLVGLQIAIWIAGGLVMSALPIERVRGEHRIAAAEPPSFDPAAVIPLEAAAEAAALASVSEASLAAWLGRPVWRLTDAEGAIRLVDAQSGETFAIRESEARAAAQADYAGAAPLDAVTRLAAQPAEVGGEGPIWRAEFADSDRTTIYIDAETGEVAARRSTTWRVYDFFWRLHVMDYDDGADFNHPLIVSAAGLAALVAASGLVLLFLRVRRSILVGLARRAARTS